MDEIEEQMNAPAMIPLMQPANSSDVKVSRIQCAKIVRRGTDHAVRYCRQPMWLKILKYSYPDLDIDVNRPPDMEREWPRPIASPFPCWNCHRRFKGVPIFLPIVMLDRRMREHGNFCSAPCANTYLFDRPNANTSAIASTLYTYMRTVHGFTGAEIGFAPRFDQHVTYGGEEDDLAFDEIIGNPNLTTKILMYPFIPSDSVVEWKYNAGSAAELIQLPPFAYIPPGETSGGGAMAMAPANPGQGGAPGTAVNATGSGSTVAQEALAAYLARVKQAQCARESGGAAAMVDAREHASPHAGAVASNAPPFPAAPLSDVIVPAAQTATSAPTASTCGQTLANLSGPMAYLAAVMRSTPVPTSDEDPVYDTKHIRQKPLAQILQRLQSLPPQEQRVAEYDLFLQRNPMDADGNLSDEDPLPPPPPKKPSKKKAATSSDYIGSEAGAGASGASALRPTSAAAFLPAGMTTADLVSSGLHAQLLPSAKPKTAAKPLKPATSGTKKKNTTTGKKTVTFAVSEDDQALRHAAREGEGGDEAVNPVVGADAINRTQFSSDVHNAAAPFPGSRPVESSFACSPAVDGVARSKPKKVKAAGSKKRSSESTAKDGCQSATGAGAKGKEQPMQADAEVDDSQSKNKKHRGDGQM
jgi:hypothetical protein